MVDLSLHAGSPPPGRDRGTLPGSDGHAELIDYADADDRWVCTGVRGGAGARGLLYRVAATVVSDPDGRILVYRRSSRAGVLAGWHDVLVGGSVRAGECYREAAVRELAEEFGVVGDPVEMWRERVDHPSGPCHLSVHHLRVADAGVLAADAREVGWYGWEAPARLLARPPQPFNPVGRLALNRLAGHGTPGPRDAVEEAD